MLIRFTDLIILVLKRLIAYTAIHVLGLLSYSVLILA